MKYVVRLLLLAWAIALVAALLPQRANAGAYTYSTTRRVFKVGQLMVESTMLAPQDPRGEENPDPHTFYIADTRTDLKPLNWEFVNPLAPRTVTQDVYNRWAARDPNNLYTLGQQVTKNMAAYWEVFLKEQSIENLLQFDLLFITNHRDTRFTPKEREKLRKLVDAGGVVWIEDCGNMRVHPSGPFFLNLQFRNGDPDISGAPKGPIINVPDHPLLNAPYRLTYDEIANLGDKQYGSYYVSALLPNEPVDTNGSPVRNTAAVGNPPDPSVFVNVVGNAARDNMPYIAAGIYGSGAVIATAGDHSCDINDYAGGVNVGSGGNSGAYCGPNIQTAHAEDLKLLYNMVAWGSAQNTERRNARRTASSFDAIGAPLLTRFDLTGANVPASDKLNSQSSPLVVNGVIFLTGRFGNDEYIIAYDAQPYRDIDGDGNPDEGVTDLSNGLPYDVIWFAPLGSAGGSAGVPSSPTYTTMQAGSNLPFVDAVLVVRGDGTLLAYRAFPRNANGTYSGSAGLIFSNGAISTGTPAVFTTRPAPSAVIHGGKIYVTQADGLIRCVAGDYTGANLWKTFNTPPAVALQPIGSPSIGYIRQQASGITGNSGGNTLDLVLYQPAAEVTNGAASAGRILPYWIGTRNEVLVTQISPGVYQSRVATQGNRYLVANAWNPDTSTQENDGPFVFPQVRVYIDENGLTAAENLDRGFPTATFTGRMLRDGRVEVQHASDPAGNPVPGSARIAVDYDLLYITPSAQPAGLSGDGSRDAARLLSTRGSVPADANGIGLDTVAITPDDILLYSAVENGLTSVYASNEQFNVGATKVRWRFTLHGGVRETVNDMTVTDLPPLLNRLGFGGSDLQSGTVIAPEILASVQPVGSPIVTNDGVAYVLANASSPANGNVTVLMAFQTNQEIVLNVGPLDASRPPVVAQADPTNAGVPITLLGSQYTVDYARGRITITNFQRPTGGDRAVSASQSFVVSAIPAGQAAPVARVFSPLDFSPLLWYYVLPGSASSSPTLIGDYIYFTQQGTTITAVNARAHELDPTVKRGQQAINVVSSIDTNGSGNFNATPMSHLKWRRPLTGASKTGTPSGSQGVLIVNTDVGPFVFEDTLTVIADGTRIIESRADGSAAWMIDSTVSTFKAGGRIPVYNVDEIPSHSEYTGRFVEERKSIARPSTVRRLTTSDLLVADTGNNRVLRVDRAGRVLWELNQFNDPHHLLAPGDPVTLSGPTDVQFWIVYNRDELGAIQGYEAHYMVADAGNFRIIEVADRYDAQGRLRNGGEKVLLWTTRTHSAEGRNFRYQSVERMVDSQGRPSVVAVVGNVRVASSDSAATTDFTGGSIVKLLYFPHGSVATPPARNGLILQSFDSLDTDTGPGISRTPILRPVYFEQFTKPVGGNQFKRFYMLCDANGVYEIDENLQITWHFTQADYAALTGSRAGLRLQAMAVRRLANGNYLITNAFTGPSSRFVGGQFTGEVFEVKPDKTFAEFSAPSIRSVGPNLFRQQMGDDANTAVLEQPLFADRLL